MWDGAQTLLGNELSRFTTNTICLILNSHECSLQLFDEVKLTLSHSVSLFFSKREGTLLKNFESSGSIGSVVTFTVVPFFTEGVVLALGFFEFSKNKLAKLFEFLIAIAGFVIVAFQGVFVLNY